MKTNPNLKLRKIANQYMIVDVCDENINMTNVFSLNETAAWLWTNIENKAFTPEDLVQSLCGKYGVEADAARADVRKLLDSWREYGLVVEEEEVEEKKKPGNHE